MLAIEFSDICLLKCRAFKIQLFRILVTNDDSVGIFYRIKDIRCQIEK